MAAAPSPAAPSTSSPSLLSRLEARAGSARPALAFLAEDGSARGAGAAALSTPFLFCHGDEDAVVPIEAGQDAEKRVRALGYARTEFRVIEGA